MTASPIAHFLRDLNSEMPQGGFAEGHFGGRASETDVIQQVEEAHIRGVLEGRAEAQAEYGAQMRKQAEEAERRLASERARWVTEEGAKLGSQIAASLENIETKVAEQVARVLKPFLVESARKHAVEALASSLDAMLLKGEYSKVIVSGPEDLLARLKASVAGRVESIVFIAVEGAANLSVTADETILETRLGAWIEAIEGASQ